METGGNRVVTHKHFANHDVRITMELRIYLWWTASSNCSYSRGMKHGTWSILLVFAILDITPHPNILLPSALRNRSDERGNPLDAFLFSKKIVQENQTLERSGTEWSSQIVVDWSKIGSVWVFFAKSPDALHHHKTKKDIIRKKKTYCSLCHVPAISALASVAVKKETCDNDNTFWFIRVLLATNYLSRSTSRLHFP